MINTKRRNNIYTRLTTILIVVVGLLIAPSLYADGSKDWYPNGATGYRAFIRSSTSITANYPFPNNGIHYVYAKVGETITLGSSAQGFGANNNTKWNNRENIKLYGPDGLAINITSYTGNNSSNATYLGNISNRTAEKAGPLRLGETANGNKYIPIYHTVTVEGVYRVEFSALSGSSGEPGTTVNANDDWAQPTNNLGIAAWDVSVVTTDNSGFIAGRVYTNVLNLSNGTSNPQTNGFYGKVFVRTKDGYTYRVNNNGNNGMYFTFFVNNNGFVDATTQLPIYKSINTTQNLGNRVHNPNNDDSGTHITHKLFYTLPATDLPDKAPIAVTSNSGTNWGGGETWLKAVPKVPEVTEPELIGLDDTNGQVSTKGGFIHFEADVQGNYTIEIQSITLGSFPTRVMTGQASAGLNNVYWDGKDGDGNTLPIGTSPVKVTVQLQGAEVHFPFFDMEYNIKGTIIELLKHEDLPTQTVKSNIVYWNDVDISNPSNGTASNPKNNSHLPPANSSGISSNSNGHIWGIGGTGTSGQFGDNKSMDTWTFITGEKKESITNVSVNVADLQITSITSDKPTLLIGDDITYTVKVKNGESNDGGSNVLSAPFSFILPPGFVPDGNFTPVFTGNNCGSQQVALTYNAATHTYNSSLNLPNGCEITYTFKVKVTEESDPANTKAIATIMRPNDVTDPDATNTSTGDKPIAPEGVVDLGLYYYPPTDPFFEVENNGANGVSNNIKDIPIGLTRESDLAIVKTANVDEAKIGDVVTFTLTVTNNGPHDAVGVVVMDNVPAGYTINNSTVSNGGAVVNSLITWNIGDLDKGQEVALTFEATVKNVGPYLNTAIVDGDVLDPDPTNNESSIDPILSKNYWIGGTLNKKNDWAEPKNWTAERVPDEKEDIEFATETNNPTDNNRPSSGPAREDLHLDTDRIIGDLINKSDKDLIVTLENLLVVDGKVLEDNTGGIIVQAGPIDTKAMGSLIFNNPIDNQNVDAIVQFHNKACECADCGFYRKQWQYFGVPVKTAEFPIDDVAGDETINMYVEPFNGDKWRPVSGELEAFKGYQINNNLNSAPQEVYNFAGTLNVGDATVQLTKTVNVNYSGTNLVSNSYTAAIPISTDAMTFPSGVEKTVYLFNTGTRDQWRKLNGTNIPGYKSGQYLAVPLNLGGQDDFPDRIPSTHAFMVLANDPFVSGNLQINYSQLTKNTKVKLGDGATEIVTRSAKGSNEVEAGEATNSTQQLPSLTIDVIGQESADRVWIFQKEGTSHNFNNGWDGRKMLESGIAQLYVNAKDESKLQVATVPELNGVTLGFAADIDGKYTLDFSGSGRLKGADVYLHDAVTGTTQLVGDGHSYSFEAKKGESANRFSLTYTNKNTFLSADESLIVVSATDDSKILIVNGSNKACSAFVSDNNGTFLQRVELKANGEVATENFPKGTYMVRLQNSVVNDVRRVVVK